MFLFLLPLVGIICIVIGYKVIDDLLTDKD